MEAEGRRVKIYKTSIVKDGELTFLLIREGQKRKLVIIGPTESLGEASKEFTAEEEGGLNTEEGETLGYRICPCSHRNIEALRRRFPYTKPKVIGLAPAIGMGDRIGLATPGHIRAAVRFGVFPVLAQQSIREMVRTGRNPEEVLDDVSVAVFQEGYRGGFSADADHLKTIDDVEATFKAGYTMYTIDPSDYVDGEADSDDLETLEAKFKRLPWDELGCSGEELLKLYLDKSFKVPAGGQTLEIKFSRESLLRAAVKYSAAIAHTVKLARHLQSLFKNGSFDLEMSVDETENPTTPLEHFFIASELRRLGVKVQSLALRYVGRFEKAIDYIGDLKEFERTLREHAFIAKHMGPYKLSVHSGSDKFSIYPILGRVVGGMLHLKTSGTSYLEALRLIARHDPELFREIVDYSLGCFDRDRRSYHLTTDLSAIPNPRDVPDEELEEAFLNRRDGRQLLHVTYGSILTAKRSDGSWLFKDRIRSILIENEEEHYELVASHLGRHMKALGLSEKA